MLGKNRRKGNTALLNEPSIRQAKTVKTALEVYWVSFPCRQFLRAVLCALVASFVFPCDLKAEFQFGDIKTWSVEEGGNDHRYQVVHSCRVGRICSLLDPMTWEDARTEAIALGGHLATITSFAEQEFISILIDESPRYLIGVDGEILAPLPSDGWWIGGFQSPQSADSAADWNWVTGEPFGYTNWATREPNDFHGYSEDYLMLVPGAFWNDQGNMFGTVPGSFVVEFPPVPEPALGAMCLLATFIASNFRLR